MAGMRMKGPGGAGRPAGPGGKGRPMAKPKEVKQTIRRVLSYLGVHKFKLIIVFICLLLNIGANILGTYMLKPLFDTLVSENPNWNEFVKDVLTMMSVYIVGIIATITYTQIMVLITTSVMCNIRNEMFEKMQKLPIRYFDTNTHGDLMSRYTNDTDTLRQMISEGIPQIISSTLNVVSMFIVMVVLSPLLTLLLLVMLAIMIFITANVGGKSGKYFMKQQENLGELNGFIEEHIEGQKVVKVFNHEEKEIGDFDTINDNLRKTSAKANIFANILMPIMGNLSYINYAAMAAAGAAFVVKGIGGLSIGGLVSFLQYSRQFSMPITQVSQQVNAILTALAGAERIFNMMDETPEADKGYVTLVNIGDNKDDDIVETEGYTGRWAWLHPHGDGTLTYTRQAGDVELLDVDFSYEEGKKVLNDITMYAKPGQKVALVGSTGAGKTTITNLLTRFYDIPEGKIRYDGININKIKKDDLRRSIALVLQDTHLFTGTVKENIRYGKLDATDEEIVAAAKLANAHDFIALLPQGYDTQLTSDGANLSQGQRQLLNIARAAVANRPVLILDEATSSIDTRTEKLIEKGMDTLMEGRTVFVIAHRLSTIRNADVIMVMEHGEIIERGNHDKLMADKGKYYQLYTGLFELN